MFYHFINENSIGIRNPCDCKTPVSLILEKFLRKLPGTKHFLASMNNISMSKIGSKTVILWRKQYGDVINVLRRCRRRQRGFCQGKIILGIRGNNFYRIVIAAVIIETFDAKSKTQEMSIPGCTKVSQWSCRSPGNKWNLKCEGHLENFENQVQLVVPAGCHCYYRKTESFCG